MQPFPELASDLLLCAALSITFSSTQMGFVFFLNKASFLLAVLDVNLHNIIRGPPENGEQNLAEAERLKMALVLCSVVFEQLL